MGDFTLADPTFFGNDLLFFVFFLYLHFKNMYAFVFIQVLIKY